MPALIAIIVGVGAGAFLPLQTVINTRLSKVVGSTFFTSLISFLVGTVALGIVLLIAPPDMALVKTLGNQPWWIWVGGFCGLAFLTLNMVLMRSLGASVTVILPITGQVIGGLTIDTLGLFGVDKHPLDAARISGTLLVILGALIVNFGRPPAGGPPPALRNILMVAGVAGGVLGAIQATVNGRLGVVLESPVSAAFVSFVVGAAGLVVINIIVRTRIDLADIRSQQPPWWLLTGGLLGAIFVLGNTAGAPVLGTSMIISVVLLGQIVSSLLVDKFGILGAGRRPVGTRKVLGAAVVLAGILCVRLLGS